MGKPVKLDRDGVPIDPNDWTYEDWKDLHFGIIAIKAKIAARHRKTAGDPEHATHNDSEANIPSTSQADATMKLASYAPSPDGAETT